MMRLRALSILLAFTAFTIPLMPVQWLLVKAGSRAARTFPHWYHRRVAKLLGLRITVDGEPGGGPGAFPTLLAANHSSWLDIIVLSAVAPLSFVAKREVGTWPFVGSLARLQRTVFVDRERRSSVAATASTIAGRLSGEEVVVLFAEGTSSDGNRVLPFKSSLFASVLSSGATAARPQDGTRVQTATIAYTRIAGLPLGRIYRPLVAWYGDTLLGPHAWTLLGSGPIDVHVRFGAPIPLTDFADRKDVAARTEHEIRRNLVALLSGRGTATSQIARSTLDGEPVSADKPRHGKAVVT